MAAKHPIPPLTNSRGFRRALRLVTVVASASTVRAPLLIAAFAMAASGCGGGGRSGGGRIAFVSQHSPGPCDVYVINADGTGRRNVTRSGAVGGRCSQYFWLPSRPAWAPDGRSIAYHNTDSGAIEVVNVDGSGRHVLVRNADAPAWSPNGDFVTFSRDRGDTGDVWAIRADGTGAHIVVRDAFWSTWSPNGDRIAFSRLHGKNADIFTAKPDGGDERRLTTNPASDVLPAWSSSDRIAFVRFPGTNIDAAEIVVVDADGKNERRLTRTGEGSWPTWSSDGTRIAFTRGGTLLGGMIFVMNADGTTRRQLTRNFDDKAPAWQPAQ